ncbi:MAG: outer membrane protein assembly factor BamD [Verrucomicrobiota bacterium]|nr:outer membrane protein assembly factor BamD [Verrucomicrobiota bacterium]
MSLRFRIVFALLCSSAVLTAAQGASVIFKPAGDRYEAPGDEKMSGSAQQLFQIAQDAENRGDLSRAQKAYRAIVRKYRRDALAAGAAYNFAKITERRGDLLKAAGAYRVVVEEYPRSPHFDESIEAQFRIGEIYLAGKRTKLLGIPFKPSMDNAIEIFAAIVRTAPYGKYTARAQFNIGVANEKQHNSQAAVLAYQSVVEKFPDSPLAADAQYQIGYIWLTASRAGVHDAKAADNARTAFQDFLFRYPKSEKVAQARENLRMLEQKQTTDAYQIAKFYDKQKNYRAAVIYYNDVIRQQPGSTESSHAKKRVDELRAKVGEAGLQPAALTAATAKKPKAKNPMPVPTGAESSGRGSSSSGGSPSQSAPLPPPEYDESLPPPASMAPDSTTAPATPSPTP